MSQLSESHHRTVCDDEPCVRRYADDDADINSNLVKVFPDTAAVDDHCFTKLEQRCELVLEPPGDSRRNSDCNKYPTIHTNNNKMRDSENGELLSTDGGGTAATAAESAVVTDSCYAWLVVCASFFNCFIVGMTGTAFAILYFDITEYFHSSKAATGWIGSLYFAIGNILCIIFSVFVGRFGCRVVCIVGSLTCSGGFALSSPASNVGTLCFTYGIVAGVGCNMIMLTSLVIVQHHFVKFRAAAAAISASGMSAGALSAGPIVSSILNIYQWRGTLLIIAAIALNGCVFGALYRPPDPLHPRRKQHPVPPSAAVHHGKAAASSSSSLSATLIQLLRDLTNVTLFHNIPFTLCCIGSFLMSVGILTFFMHCPSRAMFVGVPRDQAFLLPAVNGLAMLIGGLTGGLIGNFKCTNRLLETAICTAISGLLVAAFGWTYTFIPMALLCACVGFLIGCFSTIQPTMMSDIVGVQNIARAQAFLLLFVGVSSLIGVPLSGYIFDATHNYNIPFFVGGAANFVGGCHFLVAVILRSKLCQKEQ